MVEETEATEATETLKPGEATAIDETVTPADPEKTGTPFAERASAFLADDLEADPVEVNTGLLDDLPLPAFQRIIGLPVGGHVAAVENTRRSLMFVRGAALLYAAGVVSKTKATDVSAELKMLAELCAEGRGGDVFSLSDLLAAKNRKALN